jgi:hypothetical protein
MKNGQSHVEVHQHVRLDRALGAFETGPGKKRQAKINGGRVQREGGLDVQTLEFRIDRKLPAGGVDHRHGGVHEDAVIAPLIGFGERAACGDVTNAQVIATRADGTQARDGLPQARSAGELREDHAEQLIHAGEHERPSADAKTFHRQFKGASGKQLDELREDRPAVVHRPMVKARQKRSKRRIENEIVYPNEKTKSLDECDR